MSSMPEQRKLEELPYYSPQDLETAFSGLCLGDRQLRLEGHRNFLGPEAETGGLDLLQITSFAGHERALRPH